VSLFTVDVYGRKTVPGKVATKRTEDGHKWNTKTNATIYTETKRTKERRMVEEEMEGLGWPRKRWRDQLHLEDQGT
jgi:hypothetical protein